jgi:hypothetical protein
MQAIRTKYLPATNNKPSRIKAECEAGTITISYDHSLNIDQLHQKAAMKLLEKLNWKPDFIHTGNFKGDYYHVLEFGGIKNSGVVPEFLKEQA